MKVLKFIKSSTIEESTFKFTILLFCYSLNIGFVSIEVLPLAQAKNLPLKKDPVVETYLQIEKMSQVFQYLSDKHAEAITKAQTSDLNYFLKNDFICEKFKDRDFNKLKTNFHVVWDQAITKARKSLLKKLSNPAQINKTLDLWESSCSHQQLCRFFSFVLEDVSPPKKIPAKNKALWDSFFIRKQSLDQNAQTVDNLSIEKRLVDLSTVCQNQKLMKEILSN